MKRGYTEEILSIWPFLHENPRFYIEITKRESSGRDIRSIFMTAMR
jgi:hypothetical protein